MYLALSSDNLLYVLGLTDNLTGSYVTNASVTASLYDPAGNLVAGSTITLAYVAGSMTVNGKSYADGNYRGQMLNTVGLIQGTVYTVQITISVGSNQLTLSRSISCLYDQG